MSETVSKIEACSREDNSTNCLLGILVEIMSSEADEYNWDPLTFAFTLLIGAVAVVFAGATILQAVMVAGRGEAKSNSRVIGPWADQRTRSFSWLDNRVASWGAFFACLSLRHTTAMKVGGMAADSLPPAVFESPIRAELSLVNEALEQCSDIDSCITAVSITCSVLDNFRDFMGRPGSLQLEKRMWKRPKQPMKISIGLMRTLMLLNSITSADEIRCGLRSGGESQEQRVRPSDGRPLWLRDILLPPIERFIDQEGMDRSEFWAELSGLVGDLTEHTEKDRGEISTSKDSLIILAHVYRVIATCYRSRGATGVLSRRMKDASLDFQVAGENGGSVSSAAKFPC